MTTHDLTEADALADRVVVMDSGHIIADDTPAAIRALAGGAVVRCRSAIMPAHAQALPGVRHATSDGAELRLVTTDAAATVRRLLDADASLAALQVHDAALEDAIASLLAADQRIAA
jgi:ABC-2 type transport system ATP-binding protein